MSLKGTSCLTKRKVSTTTCPFQKGTKKATWSSGRNLRWGLQKSYRKHVLFTLQSITPVRARILWSHSWKQKSNFNVRHSYSLLKNVDIIYNYFHLQAIGIPSLLSFGEWSLGMSQRWEHCWFLLKKLFCTHGGDSKIWVCSPSGRDGLLQKARFLVLSSRGIWV